MVRPPPATPAHATTTPSPPLQRSPSSCDGCNGSGQCWVCLGTGAIGRNAAACPSCGGERTCTYCRESRRTTSVVVLP